MIPPSFRVLLFAVCACALAIANPHVGSVHAAQPGKARTTSASGQFVVYCEDTQLRGVVASFADDVKRDLADVFGGRDGARTPVVISLERAVAGHTGQPTTLSVSETPEGMKLQIDVRIGDDPAAVHLEKHLIRALLVERQYRAKGPEAGKPWVEPAWWLVEGCIGVMRRKHTAVDADLFKRLLEMNRLASIEDLIQSEPPTPGGALELLERARATVFVEALLGLQGGAAYLERFVGEWPGASPDSAAALLKSFPALGGSLANAQKWWVLELARLSESDRYQGLSAEESEKALAEMLRFELPAAEGSGTEVLEIEQYRDMLKKPGSKAAFALKRAQVAALGIRIHAMYRPVVSDYEWALGQLAKGKTSERIAQRLEGARAYRVAVQTRLGDITDFMNWYEATQMGETPGAFSSFLKLARKDAKAHPKPVMADPIASYLDRLQDEFE